MKKKRYLFGFLFTLLMAGLQAQTPYYYYAGGMKHYLELDTKHIFVSVAEKDTTNVFTTRQSLRADVPEKMLSKNHSSDKKIINL